MNKVTEILKAKLKEADRQEDLREKGRKLYNDVLQEYSESEKFIRDVLQGV